MAEESPEPPRISSTLRWADVALPPSITVDDLDDMIFARLKANWRKTALIIGQVTAAFEERSIPLAHEIVGARLGALAQAGRIESQGNLQMWRHSEVRLPCRSSEFAE